MVMDADVPVVESGGTTDFQYGKKPGNQYPPPKSTASCTMATR